MILFVAIVVVTVKKEQGKVVGLQLTVFEDQTAELA